MQNLSFLHELKLQFNQQQCLLLFNKAVIQQTIMKRISNDNVIQKSTQQKQHNPTKFSTLTPYIKEIERIRRQNKLNKTHSSRSNPHHNSASIRRVLNKNDSLTVSTQFRIKDIGTAKLYLKKNKQEKGQPNAQSKIQKGLEDKKVENSEFFRSRTVHSTLDSNTKVRKLMSFMHKKFKQASQQNNYQTIQTKQKVEIQVRNNTDKPFKLTIDDKSQQTKQWQAKRFNFDFSNSSKNVDAPDVQRSVNKIPKASKSFKTVNSKDTKMIFGVSSQRQITNLKSERRFLQQFKSAKTSRLNSKTNSSFQTLQNTAKMIKKDQNQIIETVKQHSKQRKTRNNFRKNKFQDSFNRQTPILIGLNKEDQYKDQNFDYMRKDSGLVIGITNEETQKYSLSKQQVRYRKIKSKQFNVSVEKSTQKYLQQQPYRSLKSNNAIQVYVSTVTNPSVLRANKSIEDAFPGNQLNNKVSTNANSNVAEKQRKYNLQPTNKQNKSKSKEHLQGILNYEFQFQDSQAQNYDFYNGKHDDSQDEQEQDWINIQKHIRQDDSDVHIDDLREHIGSP